MNATVTSAKRLGYGALACILLVILVAGCGSPDPALSRGVSAGARPEGRILFAAKGDIQMWDGSVHQITKVGDASSPTWSSDGNRFVFVRTGDAFSDLYSDTIDNNQLAQLTHNQPTDQEGTQAYVNNSVWALDPSWSPVADTIAFVSDLQTSQNYLWLMEGLGNPPHQIPASTTNGDNVENPSFSPDGTKVVFTQRTTVENDTQRSTGLWVVDLNSGQLTSLVKADSGAYDGAWSPDGNWIAFIQRDGTNNDLWVVPASGGQPTKLTDGKQLASPVWSPDSSQIAFFEVDGDGFKVSYVNFSVGQDGKPTTSDSEKLFAAGGIDATSAMSWTK
jgi:TolB protein